MPAASPFYQKQDIWLKGHLDGKTVAIILEKIEIQNLLLFFKIQVVYFGFAVRLPLIFNPVIRSH